MKLSTALHDSIAQTIPKLRRKKKWKRRSSGREDKDK
jgi:hypothetical protein